MPKNVDERVEYLCFPSGSVLTNIHQIQYSADVCNFRLFPLKNFFKDTNPKNKGLHTIIKSWGQYLEGKK